ncbi:hypothetical protein AMTR_s00053p00019520 [Amborella trichopoda]|uniref:Uncharacterized protein n=1 Tax=Amborella trichopoda TaxID=13333 RepID=W1PBC1_AMBTC|nr:hypothetical protein AMTR_s00053p00019520 [Amborella trichopoda]
MNPKVDPLRMEYGNNDTDRENDTAPQKSSDILEEETMAKIERQEEKTRSKRQIASSRKKILLRENVLEAFSGLELWPRRSLALPSILIKILTSHWTLKVNEPHQFLQTCTV